MTLPTKTPPDDKTDNTDSSRTLMLWLWRGYLKRHSPPAWSGASVDGAGRRHAGGAGADDAADV